MDCRTANMNPGSRYILYSAQTSQEICALVTGEAAMAGCQDDTYSQPACTVSLSDGSIWVLLPYGVNAMSAQICRRDGTCAPYDLYKTPPKYCSSARFMSFAFANRIVIYDRQDRQLQIYTLPGSYSLVTSSWSPS